MLRLVPRAPGIGAKWRAYRAIPSAYEYEGIHVNTIRAFTPPRMLALDLVRPQLIAAFRAELTRFVPDVVHVHSLIPAGYLTVGIRAPVLLTAHGCDAYEYPAQRRGLFRAASAAVRAATALVATSSFMRDRVAELGGTQIGVIFNGADESVFHPADRHEARAKLGIDPTRPVIAYAGALQREKGIFDLADAVGNLRAVKPLLLVAGDGPEREPLTRRFAERHVDARFFGVVSHSEIALEFAAADVVTLPSYGEGLPCVVCEAMLAGRAVVASAVGGTPEIVAHGHTGLLVPPRAPEQLAGSLDRLLSDVALKERFERNARTFALAHLTWDANAKAYETEYLRTLNCWRTALTQS